MIKKEGFKLTVYSSFVEDYNNRNITAHDVRRINNLNSKEYCNLRNKAINNGDIPKVRHMNNTTAKFYYQKPNGNWSVQKQYAGGIHIHIGDFPNETTAKMIRDKCIEVDWELNKIQKIIDANKVQKVKNYTLINGYWVISKTIDGELVNFCTVKQDKVSEDIIKKIVVRFKELEWNKSCKDSVLKEFNIN